MDNLYEYITALENAHRKTLSAQREEDALTQPLLTDSSHLDEIYEIFSNELTKRTQLSPNSIDGRRVFVFIVVRLFCPKALIGKRMRRGIRDQLASILQRDASAISHDIRNLIFYYKKYRWFRKIVDLVYESVMNTLNEN